MVESKRTDRRRFIKLSAIGVGLASAFGLGAETSALSRQPGTVQVNSRTESGAQTALRTYPYLDVSIELASGVGWAWSPWKEIVPAGAIQNDFEIDGIYFSGNDVDGAIELAVGDPGSERTFAQLPSRYTAGTIGASGLIFFPWGTRVPARSRVVARYTVGSSTEVYSRLRILYREV